MGSGTHCLRGLFCGLIAALMSACGSGSGSGSSSQGGGPPAGANSPELSNLAPASVSFDLAAGESASATLSFSNTGDAILSYDLTTAATWISLPGNASGTVQAGASTSVSINVTCGAVNQSGTLNLATNDADEASVNVPASTTCTPITGAFEVARVLLNQGARAFDSDLASDPAIRILAGREMVVRAFITGSGASPDARVVIERAGQADLTFAMQTPVTVSDTPANETILNASHYVVLPASAVIENASLRVEVAPFGTPVSYPLSGGITLAADDPGPFEITFVPVTFQGQTPSIDTSAYLRGALQVLPIGEVNVNVRTPYTYTGLYDMEDVLMEISVLRDLDGSNRLYHAVIIPPTGSTSTTAGIGFVGYPVSVSIDLGGIGFIIAHELGHNLSLGHAPGCGAPDADPNYPYAGGAVTTWGFDTTSNSLVAPTATKRDFMGYCNDLWVSDYYFDQAIAYRSQSPLGFGPPAGLGLTISGRLLYDQVIDVRMMPTPRVAMPVAAGDSRRDYRFVAWDGSGIEIISQSFSLRDIADAGMADAFSFNIPRPEGVIDHYEIRHLDRTINIDRHARLYAEPTRLQLSWQNSTANVQWSPSAGDALVMRNKDGQVVAVDRSGSFRLHSVSELSAELVSQGLVNGQMSAFTGKDQVVRLIR